MKQVYFILTLGISYIFLFVNCTSRASYSSISDNSQDSILQIEYWYGEYASDSLHVDSFAYRSDNKSTIRFVKEYAQYKLSIQKDSVIFSLFTDGSVPVEFKNFNYVSTALLQDSALYITTLRDVENIYEPITNFKPIDKPVAKLIFSKNRCYLIPINYGNKQINFLNPGAVLNCDTLELHKVNYRLKHGAPQSLD